MPIFSNELNVNVNLRNGDSLQHENMKKKIGSLWTAINGETTLTSTVVAKTMHEVIVKKLSRYVGSKVRIVDSK